MDNSKKHLDRLTELQSVRTTFNLTKEGKEAIDFLLKEYGLKPKEIFDELFSDENTLVDAFLEKSDKYSNQDKIKKTYVISKKALNWLNKNSKEKNIPRDILVASALATYVQIIFRKITTRAEKEKQAEVIINEFNEKYNEAYAEATNQLIDIFGEDDEFIQGWQEGPCEFGNWEIFWARDLLKNIISNLKSEEDDNH
jgi:hypothetical protein